MKLVIPSLLACLLLQQISAANGRSISDKLVEGDSTRHKRQIDDDCEFMDCDDPEDPTEDRRRRSVANILKSGVKTVVDVGADTVEHTVTVATNIVDKTVSAASHTLNTAVTGATIAVKEAVSSGTSVLADAFGMIATEELSVPADYNEPKPKPT